MNVIERTFCFLACYIQITKWRFLVLFNVDLKTVPNSVVFLPLHKFFILRSRLTTTKVTVIIRKKLCPSPEWTIFLLLSEWPSIRTHIPWAFTSELPVCSSWVFFIYLLKSAVNPSTFHSFCIFVQIGKIEALIAHLHDSTWQKMETLRLSPSGSSETHLEATILSLTGHRQNNGRSLEEGDFISSPDELVVDKTEDVRVRVRLCLMSDHDVCGDYTEAEGKLYFF